MSLSHEFSGVKLAQRVLPAPYMGRLSADTPLHGQLIAGRPPPRHILPGASACFWFSATLRRGICFRLARISTR